MSTRARRGRMMVISMIIAVLSLAGCSSGSSTPTAPPAPVPTAPATPATTITATNFDFGAPITVSPGTIVTFVNHDEAQHNVTADADKAFGSPTVVKATTTFTAPAAPGSYPFHCTFHPTMHGTLIVK